MCASIEMLEVGDVDRILLWFWCIVVCLDELWIADDWCLLLDVIGYGGVIDVSIVFEQSYVSQRHI